MLNHSSRASLASSLLLAYALAVSCQPTRDLDATARGNSPPATPDEAGAPPGEASGGLTASTGAGGVSGAAAAGGVAGASSGTPNASGGVGAPAGSGGVDDAGGAAGADGAPEVPLKDLPNDLTGSPVQGVLTFSEITDSGEKTFHVVSPLATYVVTGSSGSITTLDDRSGGNIVQWVGASSRRKRRAGIVTNPQPVMDTRLDEESFTARHVRLRSASDTGAWAWTWDFYVTQATLTLTSAAGAYSFTFSGTPGDQLTSEDRIAQGSGLGQSAVSSLFADWEGPTEWAYLTDSAYGHSLFLIQHGDDEFPDRYDAIGGDTATVVFGDGRLTRAQLRFSLGFLGSAAHSNVVGRVGFIVRAID